MLQDTEHPPFRQSKLLGGLSLFEAASAKALLELVNATASIGHFLSAGVERVTV
jgi:hypothetical protein